MKNPLYKSYSLLIALALAFVYAYYKFNQIGVIKEFSPNIISEIVGILLTVILIDQVIRRYQESETNKYKTIALRQLRAPLSRQYHLLCQMYKASAKALPQAYPEAFDQIFDDNFYSSIGYLDLSKSAPIIPEVTWLKFLDHHFSYLRSDIDNIVGKFGIYLGANTVDMLMKIKDSHLVLLATQLKVIPEVDRTLGVSRQYNLFFGPGMAKIIKDFLDIFIITVKYYNDNVLEEHKIKYDESLWNPNVMPKLGSDRIDST